MKKLYFLFLLLLSATLFTKAQTAGQYYFKPKAGVELAEMIGAATLIGEGVDGAQSPSVEFFPFTFAGNTYQTFSVSEDGIVILGNAIYNPYPYDNYFFQSFGFPGQVFNPVYPVLLPWGEDLFTAGNGSITYKINGTAPSRKLVIEFKVNSAEDNSGTYNKTFQVWLSEGSNTIQFVYGDCAADGYNNANIGIASSAANYLSVDAATITVSSTEVATNNHTGLSSLPGNGTAYVFSPTEIVDDVPVPPAVPITATLSMLPEYPVAGQLRHTLYLGYGVKTVTLDAKASGGNMPASGYTYAWSPSSGLSSTAVAAPTANPTVTTTYTVVISDANGHTTSQSITVFVNDPRLGDKFKVCKQGRTTICISKEAVSTQLQGGATLGECLSSVSVQPEMTVATLEKEDLLRSSASSELAVYPNPSAGVINVQLPQTTHQQKVEVLDVNGKVMAQKTVNEKEQTIQFDLTNKAPGIYIVRSVSNGQIRISKIMVR